MAMTGGSSSGISASSRPQQPALLQSQNFRPKSEWKHEEAASALLIYLPGFAVEQLTVTPDYSNRVVYVQGQRRLPNNRILPVNEAFTIPEEFDLSKMDKQVGRGILMLKMPKKPSQPTPEEQTTEITPDWTSEPEQTAIDVSLARDDDKSIIHPSRETYATLTEKSTTLDVVRSDGEEQVKNKEETDGHVNGKPSYADKEKDSKESSANADVEETENEKSLTSFDESVKQNEKEIKKEMVKKSLVINEVNENRKLVVNTGAAVLIIVGLGISIFYKLWYLA